MEVGKTRPHMEVGKTRLHMEVGKMRLHMEVGKMRLHMENPGVFALLRALLLGTLLEIIMLRIPTSLKNMLRLLPTVSSKPCLVEEMILLQS